MGKKTQNDIDFDIGGSSRYDALERAEMLMRNRNEAELARAEKLREEEAPAAAKKAEKQSTKAVPQKNSGAPRAKTQEKEAAKKQSDVPSSPVRRKNAGSEPAPKKENGAGKKSPENKKQNGMKVRPVSTPDDKNAVQIKAEKKAAAPKDKPTEKKTAAKEKQTEKPVKEKSTSKDKPVKEKAAPKETEKRRSKNRPSDEKLNAAPRSQVVNMSSRRRRKREKRRFALTCLGVVCVIAALLYVASAWFLFNVTETGVVNPGKRYSDTQIIEAAGVAEDSNLIRMSTEKAAASIVDALPYIENAQIRRVWPNKLNITVEYAKPIISVQRGDSFVYLNAEGRVLENGAAEKAKGSALITGCEVVSCDPGKPIVFENEDCLETLRILAGAIEKNGIKKVTSYNIKNYSDVSIVVDNRIEVRLGSAGKADEKLEFGKVVIEKNMNGKSENSIVIDLTEDKKAYQRSKEKLAEEETNAEVLLSETTENGSAEEVTEAVQPETTVPPEPSSSEFTSAELPETTTEQVAEFG